MYEIKTKTGLPLVALSAGITGAEIQGHIDLSLIDWSKIVPNVVVVE